MPYNVKGRGRILYKGSLRHTQLHFRSRRPISVQDNGDQRTGEESIRGTDSARTVIQDCAFNRTRMLVWNFPGRERAVRNMARACSRRQMSAVSSKRFFSFKQILCSRFLL